MLPQTHKNLQSAAAASASLSFYFYDSFFSFFFFLYFTIIKFVEVISFHIVSWTELCAYLLNMFLFSNYPPGW